MQVSRMRKYITIIKETKFQNGWYSIYLGQYN